MILNRLFLVEIENYCAWNKKREYYKTGTSNSFGFRDDFVIIKAQKRESGGKQNEK